MAISTNFNVNPYYDDFDEDKKFLRLLYKPGYAVQARELTQAQTILQKQIERFGNHIFKNGSVVTGGQVFLQDVTYMNLESQYSTTDIVSNDFVDKIILSTDNTKRGQVLKVIDAAANTPHTLLVQQIYGTNFASGDSIKTVEDGGDAFANRANVALSGVGTGQVFSVNRGVYYYDGYFVQVDAQTIATSIYNNNTANVKIGFEVTESIIESVDDTSLLDPAQGASNFQAPGSDRFKIELKLAIRSLDSTDTSKFVELAQVKEGVLQKIVRTPLYAELEDTLARRTFDESGDYVVNPFLISLDTNTSNTANLDITLSPGKAYVKGYEYQSIAPTKITIPKPRDTVNVSLKRVSGDYGSYLYTWNHFALLPTDTLGQVDIHCVANSSIWTANTGVYNNTKIGTARVKSIAFEATASSQSDANTYIYKTFLTDINVGSIIASVAASVNTTTFQIGSSSLGDMSNINNAYRGAKIRIVSGPAAGESPRVITSYNSSTKNITVTPPFSVAPTTASVYSIDFEIKDAESIVEPGASPSQFTSAANIYQFSKDLASNYENVFISEKGTEPLIIKIGEDFVSQNSIGSFSYEYQKFLSGVSVSAGSVDLASYLGSGETFSVSSSSSTSTKQEKLIVQTKSTSGIYVPNQIVAAANLSMSGTVLTFSSTYTGTVDMFVTVTTTAASKNKNYVRANVKVQNTGTANDVFGNSTVYVIADQGQTQIGQSHVNKLPGVSQSLYVSDVVSINAIFDFQGSAITEANLGAAANVTSRYLLDNGQRDSYYDHAGIVLKAGVTPPTGPLLIRYNKYTTSNTPGYFTVDSYLRGHNNGFAEVSYETIPVYQSQTSDQSEYSLRDYFDFRPVRLDASASDTSLASTKKFSDSTTGLRIVQNGTDITTSYQNYLPRIDKVVLNTAREFEIIRGISAVKPSEPQDKQDSMTLYVLNYPPYVDTPRLISIKPVRNQRYTMKDIGVLEKRIENLEYYTSLSLLEMETANKQDLSILDAQNLPRFKNGFIVDGFNGTSVSNVLDFDFKASIDRQKKLLRPSYNITSRALTYSSSDGDNTNINRRGPIFTVDYTEIPYVTQNLASTSVNINPFNVIDFLGKVQLDPVSDVWYDENRLADLTVDLSGDRAAWQLLVEGAAQTEWNAWQTIWSSTSTRDTESVNAGNWKTTSAQKTKSGTLVTQQQTINTLTTTTESQSRTGIKSTVTLDTITRSLGDRVVDVSIIPYMRDVNILFVADDFKPSTQLFAFFDNDSVNQYVARANKVVFKNNNLQYQTEVGNPEFITFKNNITGTSNGTGVIVKTANNVAFFVSAEATSTWNVSPTSATLSILGQSSSQNNVVAYMEHYTGNAASGAASTITLNLMADGANNCTNAQLTGEPIKIVTGTGVGQERTITAYDPTTRIATVSPAWSTTPDVTSRYTIGRLTTTETGATAGIFFLPGSTFRVGEKLFRLIDDNAGNLESSSTNGDARFFAQGLLQTKQESSVVATVPAGIQRTSVTDTRTVTPQTVGQRTAERQFYKDPLAQTFLVGPAQYPNGLFINRIRVCFKTKDPTVPVTLQVRPTVNGYPSSSVVYPFGSVTLTPDKVKLSTKPDINDSNKYTDFVFDAPIYLEPGEHSFVLLANSNKYEVFCAEKGKTNLLNNQQISEQPYLGSLFLSQNGSTWTAEQNQDMMFQIYRNSYDTTASQVVFNVNMSNTASNVVYDLAHLMTSEIILPGTSVSYKFASERAAPFGGTVGYKPIIPLENYILDDGDGRRVLNPTTGNNTFKVLATLATTDSALTPYIDSSRFNLLAIENRINTLPLNNTNITIANTGSGMTDGIYTLSLGNTVGSGAIISANVVGGSISRVWVQDGGLDYADTPTVNLFASAASSAGGYTGNMTVGTSANGASIIITGETSKSGGPAAARYIMRTVTLADGFDSGDLRVYLTAYKPAGSDIYVYVKPLSISDPTKFVDREWQLLTQITSTNFVSAGKDDFRELVYAPGINNVANNTIFYTSAGSGFTNFKTFAIKIVIAGSDTVNVPQIRDLRVIALPEGS